VDKVWQHLHFFSIDVFYIVEHLELQGGDRNRIENVCIDMSPAFISGVSTMLPNSKITFDKFHIFQHLSKAMESVRKDDRKGNDFA